MGPREREPVGDDGPSAIQRPEAPDGWSVSPFIAHAEPERASEVADLALLRYRADCHQVLPGLQPLAVDLEVPVRAEAAGVVLAEGHSSNAAELRDPAPEQLVVADDPLHEDAYSG